MDQELKGILESIQNELKSVKENQETFAKEVNHRFDAVDDRLNGIDGRLDGIDGRLDGIDGRLDEMKSQLDRIEAESNDDVVALLESIGGKIETLATKEDVEYLAARVGRNELEIDRLKRAK